MAAARRNERCAGHCARHNFARIIISIIVTNGEDTIYYPAMLNCLFIINNPWENYNTPGFVI